MSFKYCEVQTEKRKLPYTFSPTILFNHICKNKKSTLLLESAEVNTKNALYSMIITDSALKITAKSYYVFIDSFNKNGDAVLNTIFYLIPNNITKIIQNKKLTLIFPKIKNNIDEDKKFFSTSVFDIFRFLFKAIKNNNKHFSKAIFLGGMFSYNLIDNFEFLTKKNSNCKCPDFCFYLSETLIVLDHQKKTCVVQYSLFSQKISEKTRLQERLKTIEKKMFQVVLPIPICVNKNIQVTQNITDSEFINIIKELQKKIRVGDIYQIVPSRQFLLPCTSSLASYEELKKKNPSPYMFFMQDSEFTLFGASPESALKYDPKYRKIEIYPIAGTRSRGFKKNGEIDHDLDSKIELEMKTDKKELSEHLMLVDLARNDLARICKPGSRYVEELTKVDKYSYVMHLVSKVTGILKDELDIFHAYRACMNMGTLSGAPKIQAIQILSKIEKEKRGSYGGAIGYITSSGIFDTCIIIRSAYVENNIAIVQSGAGIVMNSDPLLEVVESKNKAKAVINAIKIAHSSLRSSND